VADVEHTPDGHHIVVNGRRWRATDPDIPDQLRTQLVAELMAARRGVREGAVKARARVHDAKVALGERGDPWWEEPSDDGRAERTAATVRALLRHRDATATICPSDVARVVGGPKWRGALDDVRGVLAGMQSDRVVQVSQKRQPVDIRHARGPVRIGRGPQWPKDE
jgi:hypothetical protein